MSFLFSSLFWGVFVVILGLSMVFKAVFKINFPIFRLFFALVVIWLGVRLLIGKNFSFGGSRSSAVFSSSQMLYSEGGEYDIIFGTGEIDLSDAKVTDKKLYSEVNVIFGSGSVRINPEIPTVIKISSVFAESKLPGKTINFMGDYTFKTKSYVEGEPFFRLEIDVIFGSVRIIED